jgi:hypothetical protein
MSEPNSSMLSSSVRLEFGRRSPVEPRQASKRCAPRSWRIAAAYRPVSRADRAGVRPAGSAGEAGGYPVFALDERGERGGCERAGQEEPLADVATEAP